MGYCDSFVLLLFLQNCSDGSSKRPAILVLANKIDRETEREVSMATGEEAARGFGTKFAEVSALTGEGVEEVRRMKPTQAYTSLGAFSGPSAFAHCL